jgi:hypothetical protein
MFNSKKKKGYHISIDDTNDIELNNDVFLSDEETPVLEPNKKHRRIKIKKDNNLYNTNNKLEVKKKEIYQRIEEIDKEIIKLKNDRHHLNKERFAIYVNSRINNSKWKSCNSNFVFPKINNSYEVEYIMLNNLKDFYKYQLPNKIKYNYYSIQIEKFYTRNSMYLKKFEYNII